MDTIIDFTIQTIIRFLIVTIIVTPIYVAVKFLAMIYRISKQ